MRGGRRGGGRSTRRNMAAMDGARILWMLVLCCVAAHAAGPRFVTGQPYFTGNAGVAIGWKQPLLLYSTDPGDLSATVNHAAADALVAAAAGVWNVSVASITVGQGAPLAEHVSGQNVYFDTNGLQLPGRRDEHQRGRSAAGGDLRRRRLGDRHAAGRGREPARRLPAERGDGKRGLPSTRRGTLCTRSIVINGRCTGTAAAAQLQLRYQLQRVFGRVLGLAWSQTNDNVFTGVPHADAGAGAELAHHAPDRYRVRAVHLPVPAEPVYAAAGRHCRDGCGVPDQRLQRRARGQAAELRERPGPAGKRSTFRPARAWPA